MKISTILMVLLLLSGCTTNGVYDPGKTWLLVGAVVVGSVAASQSSDGGSTPANCYWAVGPNGSTRVCDR